MTEAGLRKRAIFCHSLRVRCPIPTTRIEDEQFRPFPTTGRSRVHLRPGVGSIQDATRCPALSICLYDL